MKSVYFSNLIEDLYKKRIIIGIFVLVCTMLFAILGYRKAVPQLSFNKQQLDEVDKYNERLSEYDAMIADIEGSLSLNNQQIDSLQTYIDNSIYMRIDSQNIQTASVQYGIHAEGAVDNILSALTMYVNEGGLKDALTEEYANLDTEYWKDIITCSTNGNVLNITVIHYDVDDVKKILDIIKTRLQNQVATIASVQGNFSLSEIDSSYYIKSDISVANKQNGTRNNLKNYITNRSDLNNKLISQKNAKNSYIEKSKPETLPDTSLNITANTIKYALSGFFFGIVLPCICFMLQYILGNRIRSAKDLESYNIPVLNIGLGPDTYTHSLDRSLIDIKLLLQQHQLSSLYLNALSEQPRVQKAVNDYKTLTEQAGIPTTEGYNTFEDADELQQMISIKNCILFIKTGKDTYPQLERQLNLCRSFKIDILGCIII